MVWEGEAARLLPIPISKRRGQEAAEGHAKRFAEATGRLAKTDRVDALMLARFGAVLEPECRPLRSKTLDQLAELVGARRALVKDRTATLNRQKTLRVTLLARQAARRLTQIDARSRRSTPPPEPWCGVSRARRAW